eukprot:6232577-Amphidinium_carterae.2
MDSHLGNAIQTGNRSSVALAHACVIFPPGILPPVGIAWVQEVYPRVPARQAAPTGLVVAVLRH